MAEHRVSVDHSTGYPWALKLLPVLNQISRQHKRPVNRNWRMDETCNLVRGRG